MKRFLQNKQYSVGLLIIIVSFGLAIWAFVEPAYFLIKFLSALFLLSALIIKVVPNNTIKGLATSVATTALMLVLADGAIRLFSGSGSVGAAGVTWTYEDEYRQPDPLLGMRPKFSATTRSSSVAPDGEVIYDVAYTIDDFGFRETASGSSDSTTFLFFGGSFAFGEGVADQETFPSVFSNALNNEHAVVNLGWHGYGAHHMLRAIEAGLYKGAVSGPVEQAFYLLVPDHINRVAGFYWWNKASPRYVLEGNGRVRSAGLYSDSRHTFEHLLHYEREGLLGIFMPRVYENLYMPEAKRVALTVAIIKRSRDLLKELFNAELTCLIFDDGKSWDLFNHELDPLEKALRAAGIKVVRVSELFGSLDNPAYKLHALDAHPSALFHRRLGTSLADWVKSSP